jgi:hypothetical protein
VLFSGLLSPLERDVEWLWDITAWVELVERLARSMVFASGTLRAADLPGRATTSRDGRWQRAGAFGRRLRWLVGAGRAGAAQDDFVLGYGERDALGEASDGALEAFV